MNERQWIDRVRGLVDEATGTWVDIADPEAGRSAVAVLADLVEAASQLADALGSRLDAEERLGPVGDEETQELLRTLRAIWEGNDSKWVCEAVDEAGRVIRQLLHERDGLRERVGELEVLLQRWISETHEEYDVFVALGADQAPEVFRKTHEYITRNGWLEP